MTKSHSYVLIFQTRMVLSREPVIILNLQIVSLCKYNLPKAHTHQIVHSICYPSGRSGMLESPHPLSNFSPVFAWHDIVLSNPIQV